MSTFKLTDEQQHILDEYLVNYAGWQNQPLDGNNVVINALAGCAKTTTILEVVKANPSNRFKMVCFNDKNSKELAEIISKSGVNNFQASTLHKLAYDWYVATYPYYRTGTMYSLDLLEKLAATYGKFGNQSKTYIYDTMALLSSYCESDRTESIVELNGCLGERFDSIHYLVANDYFNYCFSVPDRNNRVDGFTVSLNCIIKKYQLEGVEFVNSSDTLIIEEYQDINANQSAILLNQNCFKIAIGDPNQNLYSWRGAGDLIVRVEGWKQQTLTTSFRVNPVDASRANLLLKVLDEYNPELNGVSSATEVKTIAYLHRTNVGVLLRCLSLDQHGIPFNVNATFTSLWKELWYISHLKCGTKHFGAVPNTLKGINTKEKLDDVASSLPEIGTLTYLFNVISSLPGGLYKVSDRFKAMEQDFIKRGAKWDVTVGTIHKMKGLEADEVILGDDVELPEDLSDRSRETLEELRIIYVALTRAKVRTILNDDLHCFFDNNLE